MPYDEATRASTQARFARIVAAPEADLDLALGALTVAADGRPDVEPGPTLAILDALADRVRVRLDVGDSQVIIVDRLHDVLYRETGFRGPTAAEYHDPRNSLLDLVAWRRVGLPISLAIVELEVAGRIGLALQGIGLPGHFIVATRDGVLMDPASGGTRLRPDDCQALIRRAVGEGVLFHSGMLRPATKREILDARPAKSPIGPPRRSRLAGGPRVRRAAGGRRATGSGARSRPGPPAGADGSILATRWRPCRDTSRSARTATMRATCGR